MMATEKLCSILSTLGGNPAALADMMDITIIDAIVARLNANIPTVPTISTNISTDAASDAKTASPKAVKIYADSVVSAANVLTAIQAMNDTQKTAVKTALGIS